MQFHANKKDTKIILGWFATGKHSSLILPPLLATSYYRQQDPLISSSATKIYSPHYCSNIDYCLLINHLQANKYGRTFCKEKIW